MPSTFCRPCALEMPKAGKSKYKPASDYGAIGNLRTVALVGRDGSIDWCCFPHLDDKSVFAAVLDHGKGGRFRVSARDSEPTSQRYIKGTNALETVFQSSEGRLVVTDFMPVWGDLDRARKSRYLSEIHRILRCDGGRVDVEVEWSPRPDYARAFFDIKPAPRGWVVTGAGPSMTLGGLSEAEAGIAAESGPLLRGGFRMRGGEQQVLVNRWDSVDTGQRLSDSLELLRRTVTAWRRWAYKEKSVASREWAGEWLSRIIRSELALKLLVHADTGAVAAAASTSLPETIGGVRNWDYRYAWIRDAAFTVQALSSFGHEMEAIDFLYWTERVSMAHSEERPEVQIMYRLNGETEMEERELSHLEGYRGSRPVRVGNGAAEQLQLDVYGEILDSAYELLRRGHELEPKLMSFLSGVADRACSIWREPDHGIWEMRGGKRHYVYSKVMVWAALDRALLLAERFGLRGNISRWRRSRQNIQETVLRHGYSSERHAFVQAFGSEDMDASNLLFPLHEFLPFDDPRIQGTIDRTVEDLQENGLVYRYRADDGLPGEEGAFGLCTFWLVDSLALTGRLDEAWEVFEGIASRSNHVGLFAEQLDAETGEFLGNFPQAFTHIGLINSALFLAYAEGREIGGPPLVGTPEHRVMPR
ncbi:MAG: glycoside hydrolase family 15 protein [Thermoleophilia bacterium]|nr:glycoside hydrolase family 15 protein [Thermoleophilia bacterium]